MNEAEFHKLATVTLSRLEQAIETCGADIDFETPARSSSLNSRTAAKSSSTSRAPQPDWIAAKSGGFHYSYDASTQQWRNDQSGAELFSELSAWSVNSGREYPPGVKNGLAAQMNAIHKDKESVFRFLAFICVHLRITFLFPATFLGHELRRLAAARAIDVRRVVRQQGHTLLITGSARGTSFSLTQVLRSTCT